jgi:hypothetical protein
MFGEVHHEFRFLADGQFGRRRRLFRGEVNDHRLFAFDVFHPFAFRFSFGGRGVG